MSLRLTLATMLLLPWFHGDGSHTRVSLGAWTLDARTDAFAGRTLCKLFTRDADYQRQAVVFQFGKSVDTDSAVYRIDGGAPIWASWDQMKLARLGFPIEAGSLDNPSQGLVRVPADRLADAQVVEIRPRPGARPRVFKIGGLTSARARAKQTGCDPEAYQ